MVSLEACCPFVFSARHELIVTVMPKQALTQLDDLMAHAEGYATFLMRKNGRVPSTLPPTPLASSQGHCSLRWFCLVDR